MFPSRILYTIPEEDTQTRGFFLLPSNSVQKSNVPDVNTDTSFFVPSSGLTHRDLEFPEVIHAKDTNSSCSFSHSCSTVAIPETADTESRKRIQQLETALATSNEKARQMERTIASYYNRNRELECQLTATEDKVVEMQGLAEDLIRRNHELQRQILGREETVQPHIAKLQHFLELSRDIRVTRVGLLNELLKEIRLSTASLEAESARVKEVLQVLKDERI